MRTLQQLGIAALSAISLNAHAGNHCETLPANLTLVVQEARTESGLKIHKVIERRADATSSSLGDLKEDKMWLIDETDTDTLIVCADHDDKHGIHCTYYPVDLDFLSRENGSPVIRRDNLEECNTPPSHIAQFANSQLNR